MNAVVATGMPQVFPILLARMVVGTMALPFPMSVACLRPLGRAAPTPANAAGAWSGAR